MTVKLQHCPGLEETLRRLKRLYEDRDGGSVGAAMRVPSPALARFAAAHLEGACGCPDPEERAAFWDEFLAERAAVDDDGVPGAYLSEMDQGLYGGLLGAEVRFTCDPATGWISSMVPPLLTGWEGLAGLEFRADGEWWSRYLRQLEVFVRRARGRFGISHFILINGLNFAFELVGATETYLAMSERPAELALALELGFRVNLAVQRAFFEKAGLLDGGTCGFGVQWLPGRILAESVDPFHMTSVADFERWGRPALERIFAQFDGGVTHLHGNGRHLAEAVASVKGLRAVHLGDDKGFPAAFDELPELRRRAGDMPLTCAVDCERFRAALAGHRLTGGVLYLVQGVPDAGEANRLMGQVRRYRA